MQRYSHSSTRSRGLSHRRGWKTTSRTLRSRTLGNRHAVLTTHTLCVHGEDIMAALPTGSAFLTSADGYSIKEFCASKES
eukprot:5256018-Amphidinium_carterae.1